VLLFLLGAMALAELLHLVAALKGGLGGVGKVVAAACGDDDGDLLPLVVAQWAPLEGVPLLLVGADEVHGLLVGPRDGLWLLRRCGVVWGGRHLIDERECVVCKEQRVVVVVNIIRVGV